jgi:hypothetical protein
LGAPEALDKNVVLKPSLAIHADLDFLGFQHCGKGFTRELAALVAVKDFRSTILE